MKTEFPNWSAKTDSAYSNEPLLKAVSDADYEVVQTETFLPVQSIYICCPKK